MATQRKTKKERQADKDLLVRVRKRAKIMFEADQENRREGLDDLRFVNVPGEQWDANMKKERGNRPCYEFNKLRINGKRIINEIRANRPQGKVRAVENGDKDTAELYEGLCRNIWNISDGDTVIDNAAEYQVDAGMACWRITTRYSDDSTFDQDIVVESIKNPFCLYVDPACQDMMKRDAEDWLLVDRISRAAFEEKYPKANKVDFEEEGVEFDDDDDWEDDDYVRIGEYWYREPYDKEIWLIDGPEGPITVDSTSDEGQALAARGVQPRKTRIARCHRIMMCIVSGDALLEGPVEWAGSEFPFVMIYGEYKVVDGRPMWWGLHRFAKDAQRSYNVSRTAIDETIAQAPKAKWWATVEQSKGLTDSWERAHRENLPFMLYNADPKAPGAPQRMGGADVPVALVQQAQISAQDMRDTTGLHEASFGEESDEKSGVALARKQAQGQVVTYNFPDNMAKGIRRTWEILVDLIPEIYDAEREVRILGTDGAEDYATVNQLIQDQDGNWLRINDLSVGKYDVAVTVGPSYTTLRQEAAEVYSEIASRNPEFWQLAGDLIAKSMDYPYADEIAKRLELMLPPQIQQSMAEGKDIPPEVQAVMARAQQAMAQAQEHSQLVQAAAQEVEEAQRKVDKDQADVELDKKEVEKMLADLELRKAQLETFLEQKLREVTSRMVEVESKATMPEVQQVKESVTAATEAIGAIDEMVAKFMEAASDAIGNLNAEVTKPKPQFKSARTERDGKGMRAVIEFDDGSQKVMRAIRQNGQLSAVPEEASA